MNKGENSRGNQPEIQEKTRWQRDGRKSLRIVAAQRNRKTRFASSQFSGQHRISLQFSGVHRRRRTHPGNASSSRSYLTCTKVYRQLDKKQPDSSPRSTRYISTLHAQPSPSFSSPRRASSWVNREREGRAIKQPRRRASSIHNRAVGKSCVLMPEMSRQRDIPRFF